MGEPRAPNPMCHVAWVTLKRGRSQLSVRLNYIRQSKYAAAKPNWGAIQRLCRSKLAARHGGSRAVQKRSEWRRTRARIAVPDLMRAAAQRAAGPQIDSAQILIEESHVDLPTESVASEAE